MYISHNCGQAVDYKDPTTKVKCIVCRCMALAFLRPVFIPQTFALIKAEYAAYTHANKPDLSVFFEYFHSSWIVGHVASPHVWSISACNTHRTTNHLEGYHNRLLYKFGTKAGFWEFIELLREEESEQRLTTAALQDGMQGPSKRTKYINLENHIDHLKDEYGRGEHTHLSFVRKIARKLHSFEA